MSSTPLTLPFLLEQNDLTQAQVSQTIQDHDLTGLAQWFDRVEDYIDHSQFGLKPAQKNDIRYCQMTRGTIEAVKEILRHWKQTHAEKATYKALLEILLDLDKGRVAQDVCEFVASSPKTKFHLEANSRSTPKKPHPLRQSIRLGLLIAVSVVIGILVDHVLQKYVLQKLVKPHEPRPLNLEMTDFEQHKIKDNKMWYSPSIYTHYQGYNICLGVVANGEQDGKRTHVTVAVFFMKGKFDDSMKWPFRGVIHFKLVDQLSGEHDLEHKVPYDDSVPDKHCSRVTEGERAKVGWGPTRFIAHTKLEPRYLKNDTLIFQIHKVYLEGDKATTHNVSTHNVSTGIAPDERPGISELRGFATQRGDNIDLVIEIGREYLKFGTLILTQEGRVEEIEQACQYQQYQVECIVDNILEDWLDGKGESPVTWATLITVLEKSGLTALASDIKSQCKTN